jgi:acyl-CoA thioester hydrolase
MEGFRLTVDVTPRFRDTDAMGHVNNAVYLTYFEVARMAYWRALTGSASYGQVPFILAHTTVDFRSPALVNEALVVGIRVPRIGRSSFDCAYRVETKEGARLVCEGRSVQVIYDYAKGASYPVPDDLRTLMAAFEGDPTLSARP